MTFGGRLAIQRLKPLGIMPHLGSQLFNARLVFEAFNIFDPDVADIAGSALTSFQD